MFGAAKRNGGAGAYWRWEIAAAVWAMALAPLAWGEGLSVEGRYLVDPNGERIVLRGANAMTMYWDADGSKSLPPLAATGANAVRLFWRTTGEVPLSELEASIERARGLGMIPIPSVWDATGKWEELERCVEWWLQPEVLAMVKRHEAYLILNVANEAGDHTVSMEAWEERYADIIGRLRAAGVRTPIMIDAAGWGRDERYLLDCGPRLREADPERNLVFSWHPWDTEQPASRYEAAMDASIEKELCFVVGEFSRVGVFYKEPIDWEAIARSAEEREIGWLWWCWRGADPDDRHALTTEYGWDSFTEWGKSVALEHPYGIAKTARRSAWLAEGE